MKFFTLIFSLFITVSVFAQNETFNNAAGDNLWSNTANWTNGVLPTGTAWIRADVTVDGDFTVERIEVPKAHDADVTISGTGTLTVNGGETNNGNVVRNQSETGIRMMFAGNLLANNTGGASNLSTADFAGNTIEFLEGSLFTVMTVVKLKNFGNTGVTTFNGKVEGEGRLTCIANNSNIVFGPTADNSGFEGTVTVFKTPVVSNTTIPNGFIGPAMSLTVAADGGSVEINGENSLGGRINKSGMGEFTVDFNANQNSMGVLRVGLNTLNIDVDPAVTELYFAPSNNSVWDTMTAQLNINGFRNGVIRFGQSDTTLTAFQLEKINIGGATPMLDQNGFLVDMITSTNAFPTVVSSINDKVEDEGFGSNTVNLTGRFSDNDGDALTLSATSSDPMVATVSIAGETLTYTEVGNGMTTITVTADDGNGGTVSDEFLLTVNGSSSTKNISPIEGLTIAPNPTTNGQVAISYNQPILNGGVKVFNTVGNQLFYQKIEAENTLNLNLSNNAAGLYFLVVEDINEGKRSVLRVIKK